MVDTSGGRVPAPGLRETADIWFDTGTDPEVVWDADGARFWLSDPNGAGELMLLEVPGGAQYPGAVARVLAEGLAACDFPPTGESASPRHVAAALRAAGLDPDAL